MRIERLSCLPGAKAARGVAVIIDVFRAFTCAPLLFRLEARELLLEADTARCLGLSGDAVLVGERNEEPIEGFDLPNSPFLILRAGPACFERRRVVLRTTAGVAGALIALGHADEVLLASFINARATAAYLRARDASVISLVAMGTHGETPAPEDERCGDYIESLLSGGAYDHIAAVAEILASAGARRFFTAVKPFLPAADPAICLQRNLFAHALRAEAEDGWVRAIPQPPSPGIPPGR
ncbi:MAG: 2-phosphosulfolactate phosphatase [Defluviicoccus sp.]